jgi:hypothetical protein
MTVHELRQIALRFALELPGDRNEAEQIVALLSEIVDGLWPQRRESIQDIREAFPVTPRFRGGVR